MNVAGIVQHARLCEMIMSESMPELFHHLKVRALVLVLCLNFLQDLSITSDHYLLDWWMTVFSRKLSLKCAARVWDLYLVGGELQLHKTAIALLKLHRYLRIVSFVSSWFLCFREAMSVSFEHYFFEFESQGQTAASKRF